MAPRNGLPSLDTPWSIGEKTYRQIVDLLSKRDIGRIVEFGSGASTVRMGHDFPGAEIVSFEHHKRHYEHTAELLAQHDVPNVTVLYCPIRRHRIGIRSYLTYDLRRCRIGRGIDFVLIDGPVEAETLRGREAPLYLLFPLVATGGLILLDDYHRESAKAVVRNWLRSYRGNLQIVQQRHDTVLLEKLGQQNRPGFPGLHAIADNLWVNLRLLYRSIRRAYESTKKKFRAHWVCD